MRIRLNRTLFTFGTLGPRTTALCDVVLAIFVTVAAGNELAGIIRVWTAFDAAYKTVNKTKLSHAFYAKTIKPKIVIPHTHFPQLLILSSYQVPKIKNLCE